MGDYLRPGVYIEDNPNTPVNSTVSTSVGGFIGVTQRGKDGVPVLITSWNAFLTEFAFGMDSPFLTNSSLAYAVYGFFQNGGRQCYVIRALTSTGACAEGGFSTITTDTPVVKAKDKGVWGNGLTVTITANADNLSNFDFSVKLDGTEVEKFENLTNTVNTENYWIDYVNTYSGYLTAISGSLATIADAEFSGGNDGVSDITDAIYVGLLSLFDTVDDVNLIAIPGQTTTTVNEGLMTYCENRTDVFGILDAPQNSTSVSIATLRKTMSCKNAALFWPWVKVSDPLSKTGNLKSVPCAGHVMGVYARVLTNRGVWKAPAGTEAIVRGVVSTEVAISDANLDALNPVGVISLVPKKGYGIVIWGARSLHPESSMKYVSDVLLDINIKKNTRAMTQRFVFEPNDPQTWSNVRTVVESFLDSVWRAGGLMGDSAAEAYYVKCDAELNTEAVRNQGQLICEVGYANKKPAEFVVFRFSHSVPSV